MLQKIVDFHTHVFPPAVAPKVVAQLFDYYQLPLEGKGTIEDLKASLALVKKESTAEGFEASAVTFSTATKAAQVETINTFIASVTAEDFRLNVEDELFAGMPSGMLEAADKIKLYGFGTLHPDYENIDRELERIVHLGLKGLKFHADFQGFDVDCPAMMNIYRRIQDYERNGIRLPVLLHMGDQKTDFSHPRRLANVLETFPDLTVVAAHFGGYSVWDDVLRYLIGRRLYLDTSSSLSYMPMGLAEELIERHGSEQILFATDYPLMKVKGELKSFNKLKLTEIQRQNILWKNAYSLLNIME